MIIILGNKKWWKAIEDTWDATLSGKMTSVIESDTAPLSSEEYWNSTTQLRNSECHPWSSSDTDTGRQRTVAEPSNSFQLCSHGAAEAQAWLDSLAVGKKGGG